MQLTKQFTQAAHNMDNKDDVGFTIVCSFILMALGLSLPDLLLFVLGVCGLCWVIVKLESKPPA